MGGNAGHRAFHQFQQCLLYAFAGHVAGDGGAIGFAGNFVDFVYIDNTALGFFHVKVAVVQQFGDNLFHIFAHIACFGERGGICHGEGNVEPARQRLCQQGFAGACGTDEQHIGFCQLHFAVFLGT